MAKVTEYPRITKMKDNDILLVDGPDGTRTILQSDAAKELGGQVIKVTEVSGESKVAVNTTGEDIGLATMVDLTSTMLAKQDWLITGNVVYDGNEIPVSYNIVWADGVQGHVSKSAFDSDVMEYTTITVTHGANTVTYHVEFDENGYVTSESYAIA